MLVRVHYGRCTKNHSPELIQHLHLPPTANTASLSTFSYARPLLSCRFKTRLCNYNRDIKWVSYTPFWPSGALLLPLFCPNSKGLPCGWVKDRSNVKEGWDKDVMDQGTDEAKTLMACEGEVESYCSSSKDRQWLRYYNVSLNWMFTSGSQSGSGTSKTWTVTICCYKFSSVRYLTLTWLLFTNIIIWLKWWKKQQKATEWHPRLAFAQLVIVL